MAKDKAPRLGLFHHAGDYVVAALLLFSLGRAHTVVWPAVIGCVALANAAMTRGPLAAYRKVSLPVHRIIDMVVVAACIVGAIVVREHRTDALVLVAVAVLQGMVVWLTMVAKRARD